MHIYTPYAYLHTHSVTLRWCEIEVNEWNICAGVELNEGQTIITERYMYIKY